MFREEFERRRRQLCELCRAVRVDTLAELQELLCAMVLAECVYKVRPVALPPFCCPALPAYTFTDPDGRTD
jgi:hypothetical protein